MNKFFFRVMCVANTGTALRSLGLSLLLAASSFSPAIAADNTKNGLGNSATIRDIRVELRDVFDGPDLGTFYRTVNSLKINTRESLIRRELLFKSGDRYDEFVVQESLRNLRSLTFLRQVSIIPVREGDYVDIIVSVQDTWTILPQISFSLGSGSDKKSAGIVETNLLGYGKRVEAFYSDDEGRQTIEGVWDDNRLFGTKQRLTAGLFERSDGYLTAGYYGLPFRTLVDPRAWAVRGTSFDLVGKLFDAGDERYIYRQQHNDAAIGYTFTRGDREVVTSRFTLGYEYAHDEFEQADAGDFDDVDLDPAEVSSDPAFLAGEREFSGPYLAYQRIEPDFISINYVDRFERVEDFNLGNEYNIKLHFAAKDLGSERDTLLLSVGDSDGVRLSPTAFLRAEVLGETRLNEDGFDNTQAYVGLKYFNVLGAKYLLGNYVGKHTLAGSIGFDFAEDLDRDREFLLGASNGLRGYDARTFTGNKRLVINLEDRFHIAEDVLQLVNIGGAIFFDAGGTTSEQLNGFTDGRIYSDVGIGLRLGFPRSSGSGVVRIDLAFPLRDGPDGTTEFEPRLLITAGNLFNARLRNNSFEPKPPALETGQND